MPDASNRIQILDDTTANQIAAGEVVERPASAVKELVENSLDAGASRILVELEEGGKSLIRVTDDGCGMSQADAILALQRHATSKISLADDLFRITTMGFRGEALPSIASVSQFTLTTKLNDPDAVNMPGVELICSGGALQNVVEVGARSGTSISVENLFFNVPARLKFLKSTNTEFNHIVELIQRFSLAYPEVAFRLTHDGRETYTSDGNGSLMDAAVSVFGRDVARQLKPIDYGSTTLYVGGFIGVPAVLRNTRAFQHTFVNRRFIRNKAITRALDEAYKSVQTIHGSKYPPAVIMITIDPSMVDVNVSPTKTEVRFTREGEVYSAVYHAVRESLLSGGLVATVGDKMASKPVEQKDHSFAEALLSVPSAPPVNTRHQSSFIEYGSVPSRIMNADMKPLEAVTDDPASLYDDPFQDKHGNVTFTSSYSPTIEDQREYDAPFGETALTQPVAAADTTRQDDALFENDGQIIEDPVNAQAGGEDYRKCDTISMRVLGQTRNTYILVQTENALLVIDQHIAHERVLYERLISGATNQGIAVQHLMLPFTLELSRREALVVEKRLEELKRAGFELEPFGGDSYVVRSVPASVAKKSIKAQDGPEAVLRSIIDEMVDKTASRKLLLPAEEVLITASCKMAVKAGDPLTFDEMNTLISDLFKTENPYTCPHGRPIILELPNNELDRKFGR